MATREELDRITLMIQNLAERFDVPFLSAALRAVDLGVISREDWQELRELAQEERVERILRS